MKYPSKISILLLILAVSSLLLAEEEKKSPPPKWTRAEIWNTKLCQFMPENKVRSLLGTPLLEYEHGHALYWFYQKMPTIEIAQNGKPNERVVRIPDSGFVKFQKLKRKPPDTPNRREDSKKIGLPGLPNFSQEPPKLVPSDVYLLHEWKAPDWGNVAYKLLKDICVEQGKKELVREPENWEVKRNWKKIRYDLNPAQVERILGISPKEYLSENGGRSWSYSNISGHGFVYFSVHKDRPEYYLSDWEEPYWPEVDKGLYRIVESPKEKIEEKNINSLDPNSPKG